jgi:hypothetical protein
MTRKQSNPTTMAQVEDSPTILAKVGATKELKLLRNLKTNPTTMAQVED